MVKREDCENCGFKLANPLTSLCICRPQICQLSGQQQTSSLQQPQSSRRTRTGNSINTQPACSGGLASKLTFRDTRHWILFYVTFNGRRSHFIISQMLAHFHRNHVTTFKITPTIHLFNDNNNNSNNNTQLHLHSRWDYRFLKRWMNVKSKLHIQVKEKKLGSKYGVRLVCLHKQQ